jgi:two-component system OmpR family sensor kinase
MRRIFWKILLSFWLALLLTGIGTAAIVTLYQDAKAVYSNLETGDRPNGITESIARTMLSGGKKIAAGNRKTAKPEYQQRWYWWATTPLCR